MSDPPRPLPARRTSAGVLAAAVAVAMLSVSVGTWGVYRSEGTSRADRALATSTGAPPPPPAIVEAGVVSGDTVPATSRVSLPVASASAAPAPTVVRSPVGRGSRPEGTP